MKSLRFLLAVAALFAVCTTLRGQDTGSRGALGSGANLGQVRGDRLGPTSTSSSPFTNGLGQAASGWTQQGTQGPELSDRVHWLQSMRPDEVANRTRWMEQPRSARE